MKVSVQRLNHINREQREFLIIKLVLHVVDHRIAIVAPTFQIRAQQVTQEKFFENVRSVSQYVG